VVSTAGDILTSLHIVESETEAAIAFYRNREIIQSDFITARVMKTDPTRDMALLRLNTLPHQLTVFELGALASLTIGQEVNAIGHPDGALWTFTRGYVSQIRANYSWYVNGKSYRSDVIQTQTPINPGNSGGPLFDNAGKLIGINTFISTGSEGIHWAVAVSEIEEFIGRVPLLEQGEAPPGSRTQYDNNKDHIEAMANSGQHFYWKRMNENELKRHVLKTDAWRLQDKRARTKEAKRKLDEAKARLDELAKKAEQDEIEWELACEANLDSDPACRGYFGLTEPTKWTLLEYLFVYDLDFIAEQRPNRVPVPYTEWTQSEVANEQECYRVGEEKWFEMHRRLDGVASGWFYCSAVNTSLNFGGPR
jgi:hypothetical protein